MKKLAKRMDQRLQKYIQETDHDLTAEELKRRYMILPVYLDNRDVGIYGIVLNETQKYGYVAFINLLYVDKKYRTNFKKIVHSIMQLLKKNGVDKAELYVNKRIAKWLSNTLDTEPQAYGFLVDTADTAQKLEG